MACASTCATQDHPSYGACLRSKSISTRAGETTKASFPAPSPKDPKT